MKAWVLGFAAAALLTTGALAQTGDLGAFAVRKDLAQVWPTRGPAWWKVSKDGSVIWIMGLPPTRSQGTLDWNKNTYRQRLKGARLFIAPYGERGRFLDGEVWPALPAALARRVKAALIEFKVRLPKDYEPDFSDALNLRDIFVGRFALTDTANQEIIKLARETGAAFVRVPYREYLWRARNYPPGDPQIAACTEAILKFVSLDPKQFKSASDYWASGQVEKMLETTPRGFSHLCRFYEPGYWNDSLALQTHEVMEALRWSGHSVAVFPTENIIAEDGILARLIAAGYDVADPSQPLPEE